LRITIGRLRIQTILLVVNLIVLILPVGSIYFLKLFEDEQLRQTEVALIDQGATIKSVKKMLYDKKERVIVTLAVLLLIVILLTVLTSLMITRPLKELIQQSERVAIGKTYQKPNLDRPGVKEIQLLAQAFSEMTERIEHRSNYIHNFAMHVSHEFKSPLTSTQGAIELLQNYYEDMPLKKRNQFFKNIAQDNDRLQRLVTRLLELARADVFEPGEEQTELVGLLEIKQEQYMNSGLAIHLKNTITSFYLPLGKEVLETIISNLFKNSLQHGANQVMVELIEKKGSIIRCHDNGAGISTANAEQIFTPFFTTNRKKGGTGLGLQIIQSLLKAHHGSIKHVPTSNGALFEIHFSDRRKK